MKGWPSIRGTVVITPLTFGWVSALRSKLAAGSWGLAAGSWWLGAGGCRLVAGGWELVLGAWAGCEKPDRRCAVARCSPVRSTSGALFAPCVEPRRSRVSPAVHGRRQRRAGHLPGWDDDARRRGRQRRTGVARRRAHRGLPGARGRGAARLRRAHALSLGSCGRPQRSLLAAADRHGDRSRPRVSPSG